MKPDCHITEKLASADTYADLLEISTKVRKDLIDDTIYRDPYPDEDEMRSHVEDRLALSYHNKCAYCERLFKVDIEHYRPKKKVQGDNIHEGYYWLCYEWTNLLPSCVKCNRDGGKHNKFPILGQRVYSPQFLPDGNLDLELNKAQNDYLNNELPLLIHPEVDVPDEMFEFELDNRGDGVRMVGVDVNNRGQETIVICKLNRQELRIERAHDTIIGFKKSVESTFNLLLNDSIDQDTFQDRIIHQIEVLKDLATDPEQKYTLLRKYICKSPGNFEKIVIPYLTPKAREIILEAFKSTY